ncbi:MAG: Ig-like domain-containing protein, partial [Flavobacterium sp.]|nr:Ig-like domain-containing protein [Flavobacterium sp.]
MFRISNKYFLFLMLIFIVGCAKRGTITGGEKDTIAPVLISSIPKNFSVNFTGKEVKLYFDEYIKLKDINKQLIVSPPMNTAPDISPNGASRFISIKIKDTLKPDTTYSFNFGQSIQDNNEGNPYPQFKYVFSTGSYIDSLSVEGTIKDGLEQKADNFVTVMLYEFNEKYSDSTVYKQKPRYVTNTLDSLKTWKIENIKAGKYVLVALKDFSNNFKFDPKKDKIGFLKQEITIPTEEKFELKLFKEKTISKILKPSQASGNRAIVGYEGD